MKKILSIIIILCSFFPLVEISASQNFGGSVAEKSLYIGSTGALTIIGWFRDTGAAAGNRAIWSQDTGVGANSPTRRISTGSISGRVLTFTTFNALGNPCINLTTGVYSPGRWHGFIAMANTSVNGNGAAYVVSATGTVEASATGTGACVDVAAVCTSIGSDSTGDTCGSITSGFVGQLSHIRAYKDIFLTLKEAKTCLFASNIGQCPDQNLVRPSMDVPLSTATDQRDFSFTGLKIISGTLGTAGEPPMQFNEF